MLKISISMQSSIFDSKQPSLVPADIKSSRLNFEPQLRLENRQAADSQPSACPRQPSRSSCVASISFPTPTLDRDRRHQLPRRYRTNNECRPRISSLCCRIPNAALTQSTTKYSSTYLDIVSASNSTSRALADIQTPANKP